MYENVISMKANREESSSLKNNARDLSEDMTWCEQVIEGRLKNFFDTDTRYINVVEISPPNLHSSQSPYAEFIHHNKLDFLERLLLVLALVPVVSPKSFDIFRCHNDMTQRPYTEFSCMELDSTLFATGETLAFLLGGQDLESRLRVQKYLESQDKTILRQQLLLESNHPDPILMKTPLQLNEQSLHSFTTGQEYRPDLSEDFPAKQIHADLQWDDLILPAPVKYQLEEIRDWTYHEHELMKGWGLNKRLNPGYRALFYGPPGTGKTLAASLLGNTLGRAVYRVDLSLIVSKYIGETEKNLEKVFAQGENKSWILFFDEADALFGKRIQTAGANDQFANQNVSYLLQRIEKFNGIVILASNFKDNFDEAFFRRFDSMVYFPLPTAEQRLSFWQQGFSSACTLAGEIDLEVVANKYELSGAQINNVIRFVSLKALSDQRTEIWLQDIDEGIRRQKNTGDSEPPFSEGNGFDVFNTEY